MSRRSLALPLAIAALAAVAALTIPARSAAQAAPAAQDTAGLSFSKAQLDSIRTEAASARKQTVAANMVLTDAEAKAFWPVYDKYRAEIAKVRQQEWNELHQLLTAPASVTAAKVKGMTNSWLSLQVQEAQVRAKYFAKFSEVLPAMKVARYYQIEHRLDLLVQVALAQEIPLVE